MSAETQGLELQDKVDDGFSVSKFSGKISGSLDKLTESSHKQNLIQEIQSSGVESGWKVNIFFRPNSPYNFSNNDLFVYRGFHLGEDDWYITVGDRRGTNSNILFKYIAGFGFRK